MSSLQERTLVVKGYDPNRTTKEILEELFIQGGPVRNIVFRPDHSFVEFEDKESVGFALALFRGLELFKRPLIIEPKLNNEQSYFKYIRDLDLVYNQLMLERNLMPINATNVTQQTTMPHHAFFQSPQQQQQIPSPFINHQIYQRQAPIFQSTIQPSTSLAGPSNSIHSPVLGGGQGILPLNPNQIFLSPPSNIPQMIDNYNNRHQQNKPDWNFYRNQHVNRRDFETYRNSRDNNMDEPDGPASGRSRDRSRSPVNNRFMNRDNHHNNNRDFNNRRRVHNSGNVPFRSDRGNNLRSKGSYNKHKR